MPTKKETKPAAKAKTATSVKPAKKSLAKTVKKDASTLTAAAKTVGGIIGAAVGKTQSAINTANEILAPPKPAKTAAKKSAVKAKTPSTTTTKAPAKSKAKK